MDDNSFSLEESNDSDITELKGNVTQKHVHFGDVPDEIIYIDDDNIIEDSETLEYIQLDDIPKEDSFNAVSEFNLFTNSLNESEHNQQVLHLTNNQLDRQNFEINNFSDNVTMEQDIDSSLSNLQVNVDEMVQEENEMNGMVQEENEMNGMVQEDNEMNGMVQEENEMNGMVQEENEMNGMVQEDNEMNGMLQEENEMNGMVQEENEMNGMVQEENEMNGLVQEDNEMNGMVQEDNEMNGLVQEDNEMNGMVQEDNEMNGLVQEDNEMNGRVQEDNEMNGRVQEDNEVNGVNEENDVDNSQFILQNDKEFNKDELLTTMNAIDEQFIEMDIQKMNNVANSYEVLGDLVLPHGIIDDPDLIADLHELLTSSSNQSKKVNSNYESLIIVENNKYQVVDVVDESSTKQSCTVCEIEENYDDIEETMLERLYGLTEMFNPSFVTFVTATVKGVSWASTNAFNVGKALAWFGATAFIMVALSPMLEIENARIEEAQMVQQRQMLAGSGAQMMQPGSLSPSPITGGLGDHSDS